jgi:hypothetical protein
MFSTKLQSLVELIAVARLVENAKVLSLNSFLCL